MLKRKIATLLSLTMVGLSCIACSDSSTDNSLPQNKYPLTDFSVKVGDSYYHGKIDQTALRVEVTVEDFNAITEVDYVLKSKGATIVPDPATFVNEWEKEQTVTVTTEDNATTTYTIVLTKFDEALKGVIFMDNFDTDGTPNAEKWTLCSNDGSDWCDEMSESYDQAYVKNGNLILVGEKVDNVYQAGGIETRNKFSFTFGKVEVRARVTQHPNGAFPAIWLMPQVSAYKGWPNGGEIDMMEHIKQERGIYHTIHTNYTYNLGIKDPINSRSVVCNYEDYNIYGLEWTEDHLVFSINGEITFTYPNLKLADEAEKMQWPFTKDSSFYLIVNMGLGGDREGSWAGPIDDANLPAQLEIDWVKVTRLK